MWSSIFWPKIGPVVLYFGVLYKKKSVLIRESKFTQMGLRCECVTESKQTIGGNISNKPTLIMSGEKNDWLATFYVIVIKCKDFT